jgi:16S rRNA (adenine1518-N6/adenine1519-N6)-dimethyltransferase
LRITAGDLRAVVVLPRFATASRLAGARPGAGMRKRFGQHFLADRHYVARIVDAIDPQPGNVLVEVGPGDGALTAPLLERIDRLHAVEIDRDLCAALAARFPAERLALHAADALRFDFAALGRRLRLVGNLPYNISTPLLFRFAALAARLVDGHFMLQREVVDRMVAVPSTPAYGRLSVMLQHRFAMRKLFDVPPGAFRPPPQVDSSVVRMTPLPADTGSEATEEALARVVHAAFTQRRKTVRNSLAGVADRITLEQAGVAPEARAENLSVDDYRRLAAEVVARERAG